MRSLDPLVLKSAVRGFVATAILGVLIVVGSRNLQHFDAALVGYTFATLFATFGITYRYSMWLQRPPTQMYWRRGWQVFISPRFFVRNLVVWLRRLLGVFVLNGFIWRRGNLRWSAHWLIMWGCLTAVAITFPLVFGWIHFETLPNNFEWYRVYVFGFPTISFPIHSLIGFMTFHGLVWASFLVIPGVMIAMYRRMRDHGAAAVQQFGEDILPLFMLFAISVTGLMLTASYSWMKGYGYEFLAILHAITVIFTLLWLPFGKFFHIFQRPAQLGVAFYRDAGARVEQAKCARCGNEYASKMHVEDLITIERQLGFDFTMPDHSAGHYQRICPPCRRAMLALSQSMLRQPDQAHSDLNWL
ncbi:MAG TPA: hypothetical protein VIM11_01640 [Tepidisphaeraceae bacterium]|jgi:hypothetical protein